MITIVCMCVIVFPAQAVIEVMTCYYKENSRSKQPIAPLVQKTNFNDQQKNAKAKKNHWDRTMVMFNQSMI